GELPKCAGARIYAVAQIYSLWPVRLQSLLKNSFIVVSHHAQAVVPRTNMSAEQWDQSRNDTADVAVSETLVTVSKLWG
ncbi:MAG: hypothetical protein ACK56F_27885, partial [bacterium]